ncbi:F-box only protein 41-like [Haemaphysalis longicornis]
MAGWCSETQSIALQALAVTPAKRSFMPENFRGQLEHGLDKLLKACSKTLKAITVVGCDNVLTDRVLWLASACSFLEVVVYIAVSHVTLPEALWSLGAGCRRVKTLIIPPMDPRKKQGYAGHRVCQIVGKCWPQLRVLCIGGRSLSLASICSALRGCVCLESFEIDRGRDIEDKSAEALVEAGLQRVELFYLTHTVVSAAAAVILHGKSSLYNIQNTATG